VTRSLYWRRPSLCSRGTSRAAAAGAPIRGCRRPPNLGACDAVSGARERADARGAYLRGLGSTRYTDNGSGHPNPVQGCPISGAPSFLPVSNWKEFESPFWRFSLAQHGAAGLRIHRWRCFSFLPASNLEGIPSRLWRVKPEPHRVARPEVYGGLHRARKGQHFTNRSLRRRYRRELFGKHWGKRPRPSANR